MIGSVGVITAAASQQPPTGDWGPWIALVVVMTVAFAGIFLAGLAGFVALVATKRYASVLLARWRARASLRDAKFDEEDK